MKNLLLAIISIFIAFQASSQTIVAKDYIFKRNNIGYYEVTDTIPHNLTKDICMQKIASWARFDMNTFIAGMGTIVKYDDKKGTVYFSGKFQYRKAQNPFAGTWTEALQYECSVKIEDTQLICTFYNMHFVYQYSGYGSSTKTYSMTDKMFSYIDAVENLNKANTDPSIDKKEKKKITKESEAEIAEDEISFSKSEAKLKVNIEKLRRQFR
mgnify:CR=1 FL=1